MQTNELTQHVVGMPETLQDKLEMANVFVRSNLMPKGLDRPEKVVIALELGHELGLPPLISVMNIAVINNVPTLKADMMVALAMRSGIVEDIKIEFIGQELGNDDDFGCKVTIVRKGIETPFISIFTRRDAKVAGLFHKENWKRYEKRMLKHRAMAFAIRDSLPELFSGIYLPDEVDDLEPEVNIESSEKEVDFKTEVDTIKQEFKDSNEVIDETEELKITDLQLNAIQKLSSKILPKGILESFLYTHYNVKKCEELTKSEARDIILLLQNDTDRIYDWVEQNYNLNTA
jgi:hypothetical protein